MPILGDDIKSDKNRTRTSQIEILSKPVYWRYSREELGPTRVFYDEYHNEIILITSDFICKSHISSSKLTKFDIKLPNHSTILQAKFSFNNKWIGLQNEAYELKIIDIKGRIIGFQQCKNSKYGNKIMDFHFVISNIIDICVITLNGIEFYQLYPDKKKISLYKSTKYEVKYHWYLPSKQFIMVINSNYIFQGLKIKANKNEKINKFEIVGVEHQKHYNKHSNNNNKSNNKKSSNDTDTDSNKKRKNYNFFNQITLVNINDKVGCVFVDNKRAKIYLFQVNRQGQMESTHSYNLYSQGSYSIFHIDNILVAYNKNTEV